MKADIIYKLKKRPCHINIRLSVCIIFMAAAVVEKILAAAVGLWPHRVPGPWPGGEVAEKRVITL